METKQENETAFFNEMALNEFESNGVLYVRSKPSQEAIGQLRAIKKDRFNDMIATADKVAETCISEDLKEIGKVRKEKREEIETRITNKLLLYFQNTQGFSKGDLNSLFPTTEERTRRRLTDKIIKNLSLMGKIKKVTTKARYINLVNRQSTSQDYGSFALLMAHNKRKPRNLQGCFLSSSLSVGKKMETYEKSFYELTA